MLFEQISDSTGVQIYCFYPKAINQSSNPSTCRGFLVFEAVLNRGGPHETSCVFLSMRKIGVQGIELTAIQPTPQTGTSATAIYLSGICATAMQPLLLRIALQLSTQLFFPGAR